MLTVGFSHVNYYGQYFVESGSGAVTLAIAVFNCQYSLPLKLQPMVDQWYRNVYLLVVVAMCHTVHPESTKLQQH